MTTGAHQAGEGKIFCKQGKWKGKIFDIAAEVSIGRGSHNRVVIPDDLLSQRHARIFFDPARGCYVLEDLKSRNGTALDGIPIRDQEPLGHVHVITLAGAIDFIFQDMELYRKRHPTSIPPQQGVAAQKEEGDSRDVPTIILDRKTIMSSDATVFYER